MSYLKSKQRREMPRGEFAVPSKAPGPGSYPIPDKAHARSALSRGAANASPSEMAAIWHKVAEKFPGIKQSSGRYKRSS
jgi:hypothetical protein